MASCDFSTMRFVVVYVALLVAVTTSTVEAFGDGAKTCKTGSAAVSGSHLQRGVIKTGPITKENFQLYINNVLIPAGNVTKLDATKDHKIQVKSTKGTKFKGALIVLSKASSVSGSVQGKLSPVSPYKLESLCVGNNNVGITHANSKFKTAVDGTIKSGVPVGRLNLDINLVLQNNKTGSVYYYSRYAVDSFKK